MKKFAESRICTIFASCLKPLTFGVWAVALEYERRKDGQLESLKILFLPDINDINLIDTSTSEGKLLLAAVAKITTESQTDKTPNEVLNQLEELSAKMK